MSLEVLASVQGDFKQRVLTATGLSIEEFYNNIHSKQTSKIVQISIHNKCPQNCSHCFQVETAPGKKSNLNNVTEYLNKFDSSVYRKYPFPREPLLLPELFPVYRDVGCTEISSTSLVILKRPHLIQELKNNNITTIFVSLHGDAEQHTKLTNSDRDKYSELMDSIKVLIDSGFNVEIITTLCSHNKSALEHLPNVLLGMGISKWWIQRIMPTGRAIKWKLSDFLYGDECEAIMEKFATLRSRYSSEEFHIGLDLTWGPNFYSAKMLQYLSGKEKRWPWSHYVCPAVTGDSRVISCESGDIYPCLFFESFPEAIIGNIENPIINQHFSENSLLENLEGQCKDCSYKPFCLGGCRAVAFSFAKLLGNKNPFFAGQDFCLTRAIDNVFR